MNYPARAVRRRGSGAKELLVSDAISGQRFGPMVPTGCPALATAPLGPKELGAMGTARTTPAALRHESAVDPAREHRPFHPKPLPARRGRRWSDLRCRCTRALTVSGIVEAPPRRTLPAGFSPASRRARSRPTAGDSTRRGPGRLTRSRRSTRALDTGVHDEQTRPDQGAQRLSDHGRLVPSPFYARLGWAASTAPPFPAG